jgi:hypothetical protein
MSSLFCSVNLNGIEALLTGESRCYIPGQRGSGVVCGVESTHDVERVAPGRRCHAERPPLSPLKLSQGPGTASESERGQLRGHCERGCGLFIKAAI